MRRQFSSTPNPCTEGMDVYAAGISVKAGVRITRQVHRSDGRSECEVCGRSLNFDEAWDAHWQEGKATSPPANVRRLRVGA